MPSKPSRVRPKAVLEGRPKLVLRRKAAVAAVAVAAVAAVAAQHLEVAVADSHPRSVLPAGNS